MIFGDELTTELKWQSIRGLRNRFLSESDWTQLPDSTSNKSAWLIYRNELRNIPQNFSIPEDVVFPVKPE